MQKEDTKSYFSIPGDILSFSIEETVNAFEHKIQHKNVEPGELADIKRDRK